MAPYEDNEQMLEDQILSEFLDNAVKKAKKNIEENGVLSTEDAIPLMLKSQFNHIAHLEAQMVTKTEFNGLRGEFNGLRGEFNGLKDEVRELKVQLTGLKEQFDGLKEQFSDLKEQVGILKEQFDGFKSQFSFLKWLITFGFAFLAAMQIYLAFIK